MIPAHTRWPWIFPTVAVSDSSQSTSEYSNHDVSRDPEFLQPTPDDGKKRKGKSKAKKAGGKKRKTRSGAIDVKARLYEYQRFKHSGPPITDFKDVPKGWQCQDLDLDERCGRPIFST